MRYKRARFVTWIICGLLLAFWGYTHRPRPTFQLADGTSLSFDGVVCRTVYKRWTGEWWQYPTTFLPESWRLRLIGRSGWDVMESSVPMMRIRFTGDSSKLHRMLYTVSDTNGIVHATAYPSIQAGELQLMVFNYPRHADRLKVNWFEMDELKLRGNLLGSFQLQNPSVETPSTLQPIPAVPITKPIGDVSLTLQSFDYSEFLHPQSAAADGSLVGDFRSIPEQRLTGSFGPVAPSGIAVFKIGEAGTNNSHWMIQLLLIRDATGNVIAIQNGAIDAGVGILQVPFPPLFCPEQGWKITGTLNRMRGDALEALPFTFMAQPRLAQPSHLPPVH